jgi:hypothetical protein
MRNVLAIEEPCLLDAVPAAYLLRCRVTLRDSLARHCIVRRPASSTLNTNVGVDDIESKLSHDLHLSTSFDINGACSSPIVTSAVIFLADH